MKMNEEYMFIVNCIDNVNIMDLWNWRGKGTVGKHGLLNRYKEQGYN